MSAISVTALVHVQTEKGKHDKREGERVKRVYEVIVSDWPKKQATSHCVRRISLAMMME
jgi:hypothetical protein